MKGSSGAGSDDDGDHSDVSGSSRNSNRSQRRPSLSKLPKKSPGAISRTQSMKLPSGKSGSPSPGGGGLKLKGAILRALSGSNLSSVIDADPSSIGKAAADMRKTLHR